ncbi:MAG: DUF86 domain-containing protein [Dehalococcoidia bacterium]|nr:DUF86 domain-containing protein [Dehalococcoidia bacterium]
MEQHKENVVRLHHMMDYAQKAINFTRGKSRSDLDADEMLAMATIHSIEIIGEAIRSISEELQTRHPEIPWNLISGTRNQLAHGYIDVDLDIIWTIVTKDLPPLVGKLEQILEKEGWIDEKFHQP